MKTYLITGAQQGIGAAVAVKLGASGARVGVNYLDDPVAAERIAADISAAGGEALLLQADISSAPQVQAMVDHMIAEAGPLDGLVNNAGVFPRASLLDIAEDEWDRVMAVNLKGTFLVLQAVARSMVTAGRGGAIVNMSSRAAHSSPMGAHYGASKGGILTLTRTAATELAPHRIRVNAVSPGLIFTAQPRDYWPDDQIEALGKRMLLGRVGTADEVADTVLYLLGDRAAFITGENIIIDGGGI